MNIEKLKILKSLINEELELYTELDTFFEEKRKILISNSTEELLAIDDKILNTVASIKSAVNHRQQITFKCGYRSLNMSQIIELAKNIDADITEDFKITQKEINELINEIAKKERIIKELIRHGMNMVNKTLGLISNATTLTGDYNNRGKSTQGEINRISSVVEEV